LGDLYGGVASFNVALHYGFALTRGGMHRSLTFSAGQTCLARAPAAIEQAEADQPVPALDERPRRGDPIDVPLVQGE
jgi:hypothetical protein